MPTIYRPDNFGNAAMRRAFLERDNLWLRRIEEVCEVLHLDDQSAAYKMCSPIGRFGSGRPGPFHQANELIRRRHELDLAEQRPVPFARELAYSTVEFYLALTGERATDCDNITGLKLLFQHFASANVIGAATALRDLPPEKLRDFAGHMESAQTVAAHMVATARARLREMEARATGAPIQRENAARESG